MRAIFAMLMLVAILSVPLAAAEPEIEVGGGPMTGKCLTMRGLTRFSLSLAHCMPNPAHIQAYVDEAVG